jgi:ribonuclease P protein component
MATPSRIRRTSDFRRVVHGGRALSGRRLTAHSVASVGGTRAGFVVRREVGSAVARNRARRVMKEAWRSIESEVASSFDVVFVARPAIAGCSLAEVAQEMRALLVRKGVIPS